MDLSILELLLEKYQRLPLYGSMDGYGSFDNTDDMWDYFCGLLDYSVLLDSYVPLKRVSCKHSKCHTPWMTPEILCAIKAIDKTKCKAEHTKDP